MAAGWLELPEQAVWIPENILWTHKATHCPMHTLYGNFCAESRTCSLTITQLLASPDGSPRNVVSNNHAN